MDVDEFDESIFLNWQNPIDALPYANIESPVELSFLDDFLDIKEDITVVTCAGYDPANIVPSLPNLTEPANSVQSHVCLASGVLDVILPTCNEVGLRPTEIISSPGSAITTCVNDSELWVQQGSCVTKEISPLTRVHKNQSRAAGVFQKKIKTNVSFKPVRQFHSNVLTRLPISEEHILRERTRREDMARRFLLLEKVLPEAAARVRSSAL